VDFTKIETVLGIIAGAIVLTFVGWAVSSFGMASPYQLLAYDVGQTIEADGVAVDRVTCGEGVATPSEQVSHLLEIRGEGGDTVCRVNLTGGGLTSVMVTYFEDGSWRFTSTDDRP
jgi:hypothetical protein